MEKVKVDPETTGHGMILGLTIGKVNQESIPLRSSMHGSLETKLLSFGLEVRTPTMEEPENKGETLQSENVQCVKVDTPTSDVQKTWQCVKTADSAVKTRIKKLVTCKKHEIADEQVRGSCRGREHGPKST